MRFTPLSESEMKAQQGVLKPGIADFEVADALDMISRQGNEMIKLTLKVNDVDGTRGTVFDYLVSNVQWKILGFFQSIGTPQDYIQGNMNPDALIGACGKCSLVIQKDKTGQYGDQIRVKEYLKTDVKNDAQPKSPLDGDDIPF